MNPLYLSALTRSIDSFKDQEPARMINFLQFTHPVWLKFYWHKKMFYTNIPAPWQDNEFCKKESAVHGDG
jgi:hypothetical protein